MKPERWRQVERLYGTLVERPPGERRRLLDEACGADDELRRQVGSLLEYEEQLGDFLESTALAVVADELANEDASSTGERHDTTESLLRSLCLSELGRADPHLLVKTPEGRVRRLPLTKDNVSVGRESSNDVAIPDDDGLSRRHVVVRRQGDAWTVTNVGKNGTLVNGKRIRGTVALRPGDQILASCVRLTFCDS